MNGDRLVVKDVEWLAEVVEHWPPGGPDDRPTAVDLLFYDPDDRRQWVGNCCIPYTAADLSEEGLHRLFSEADARSWRDREGAYWRIQTFSPGSPGAGGDGDLLPDGILSFHKRNASDSRSISKVVTELPPVGLLSDEDLQQFLSAAAPRDTAAAPRDTARRTASSETKDRRRSS